MSRTVRWTSRFWAFGLTVGAVTALPNFCVAQEHSVLVGGHPAVADPPKEPSAPTVMATDQHQSSRRPRAEAADRPIAAASPVTQPSQKPDVTPEITTARFNGVQPGVTSVGQLLSQWGKPTQQAFASGREQYVFQIRPFRGVMVEAEGQTVSSIQLELAHRGVPATLAQQLKLDKFRPAPIHGPQGTELGMAIPERGVVFTYAPNTPSPEVSHVLIEPISAQPFELRAQLQLHGPYQANLHDLHNAAQLAPQQPTPWQNMSIIQLATGQPTAAEKSAKRASDLDPANAMTRLHWAACLAELGNSDDAYTHTHRIVRQQILPPHQRAVALVQLADLSAAAMSTEGDPVTLYQQAIELAAQHTPSKETVIRQTAKRVLVDAHLGMAREIARGQWGDKSEVVPQWLDRASAFADDLIKNENASPILQLRVSAAGLDAFSAIQPAPNASSWIAQMEKTTQQLLAAQQDPLWQSRVHWEAGQALLSALRLEHARGQADSALRFGELAVNHFRDGAKMREATPVGEHLVGRLYFHIGAVHAILKSNHADARPWYDKAAALLARETPRVPGIDPRLHGDSLVSMGVSFWETGDKERAVQITQRGEQILRQAVEAGTLDEASMAVAYKNLATMHQALGNEPEARRYTEIAENSNGTTQQ